MADFTSALYLGMTHASRTLPEWEGLTLGKPAALASPPGAAGVERQLAELTGCERALLAPSTLHLFWDLLPILSARDGHLFVERGSYPIARWGVERAAAHGTPAQTFGRHDVDGLRRAVAHVRDRLPIVVADGVCLDCGRLAPLSAYLQCVAGRDGLVIVDDTQALGIFGRSPDGRAPYGRGGGGSLDRAGIRDDRIVVASSLAKAFGAPIAMLAGADAVVSTFERRSDTRVHCSPPSSAAIAAAARALEINRRCGDRLRWRLAHLVSRLRRGLRRLNLASSAGLFPVQSFRLPDGMDARTTHEALMDRGVKTVVHRGSEDRTTRVAVVLTARHRVGEIDHAVACLADVVGAGPRSRRQGGPDHGRSIRESHVVS